jgi:hypothetical protein
VLITKIGFFHSFHSILEYVAYFLASGLATRLASGRDGGSVRGGLGFVQQQRHMHTTPMKERKAARSIAHFSAEISTSDGSCPNIAIALIDGEATLD